MCRHVMHVFCAIALSFFCFLGVAQAASLGKVDVASHLGEPFYAEIPLNLEKDEKISSIFVELASGADYRILEVFHDAAVDFVRIDVKSDGRGTRIELTSTNVMEAPFLNLVLKVRYGRATHFKKFSIFLDLPRAARLKPSVAKTLPVRAIEDPVVELPTRPTDTLKASSQPEVESGWARVENYGPMVFGDTISTVARRLRMDERYTQQQVMAALFEKNQSKFDKGNINLIRAGTYLDVPTAKEVEHITHAQASKILRTHNKKWKELTKQTKYAKVQSAQKNRYSKNVSIGEEAEGVASQSVSEKVEAGSSELLKPSKASESLASVVKVPANTAASVGTSEASAALVLENSVLQQRLKTMEIQVAKLESQPTSSASLAAAKVRIGKLDIELAQLKGALEKARNQAKLQSELDEGVSLLTWILMGFVTLLSIVAGYLAYALNGQRRHPVEQEVSPFTGEPELEEVDIEEIDIEEVSPIASSTDNITGNAEENFVDRVDDAQDSLAIRIPELTDEDTSEMEAFSEAEEDPDPNVDYLTEADVYMRYGMEDEAEKQVGMALRLRSDNKDAHIKLAEIRHAKRT